ncbi:MAG: hypothetical protein Ta2A_05740 [Treponemataceae bacterium]|nr:MAG: hypothetical protein Ta2A_05740 [Treponemataceae bacterium]
MLLFLLAVTRLPAAATEDRSPFSSALSPEEISQLSEKKLVYRSIGNLKKSGIESDNPNVLLAKAKIQLLKPNYLSEAIFVLPFDKNKNAADKLFTLLDDVEGYTKISYWSFRHQTDFWLYSYVKNVVRKKTAARSDITALFKMSPFDEFAGRVELTKGADAVYYSIENTDPMKYDGIPLVKKSSMISCFVLFRHGDNLVFYGLGGAKVTPVPFYSNRIEDSIMGRVKSISEFVYGKF